MKDFYVRWMYDKIKEDVVLSHSSALRFLMEINGIMDRPKLPQDERRNDVYALEQGQYEDVHYHVVDSFDGIDIETLDNLRFTSLRQSVNDLLRKSAESGLADDEKEILVISLTVYYVLHGFSFDNLKIHQENMNEFENMKAIVLQYNNDIMNEEQQYVDDIEKRQAENRQNETSEFLRQMKCETCLYASQCDGYEYAPYCLAEM